MRSLVMRSAFIRTVAAGSIRAKAILGLAGALLLAGCGAPPAPPQSGGVPVSFVQVETQDVTLTTELTGRVAPFRVADIRPQVSGVVLERLFEEGGEVAAGQSLYRIDPAPYRAALDNASAALARAEANLRAVRLQKERVESLLPSDAVSQQDFDNVVAALASAEADVKSWQAQRELAEINLGYTAVQSPISGRIGRSSVTEGAAVTAYQPLALATVQQLDPVYVDMPQSTAEVQRLKRELADGSLVQPAKPTGNVRILLEDGSPYARPGTLQFRDISVNPATASVILRASVPNPDGDLLPDMFVHAQLTEGTNRGAVLIPQQAVLRDPKGNPYSWVVGEDGTAQMRQLVLDRAVGDKWVVLSGLAAGESLIVEGLQRLRRPGTPLQPTPWVPAGGAATGAASGQGQ